MRTSRTFSALTVVVSLVFLVGSDCGKYKFNWWDMPTGEPCNQVNARRCPDPSFVQRCDGTRWVFERDCVQPQSCAMTSKGAGCWGCPEGAAQCPGPWPYDELRMCVSSGQGFDWETTHCRATDPISMCWYDISTMPAVYGCYEIEAHCPIDPAPAAECDGGLVVECAGPTILGAKAVFEWMERVCPEGTTCQVVLGRGQCVYPEGVDGGPDGGP